MAFKLDEYTLKKQIAKVVYNQLTARTIACVTTLANGFEVVGTSAVPVLDNFDEAIGKKVAYENAFEQLWELEGYAYCKAKFEREQEVLADAGKRLGFPAALSACLSGFRIFRAGWNGKFQWVTMTGERHNKTRVEAKNFWSPHARQFAKDMGGVALVNPGLLLKAADGSIVMGWVPSTGDLMAGDWEVLPN